MSKKDKSKTINTRHLKDLNDRIQVDKSVGFMQGWNQQQRIRRQKKTVKIVAFATVFIFVCIITVYVNIQIQNNKEYVQNITYEVTPVPSTEPEVEEVHEVEMSESLFYASEENSDTVGWLTIEDTKINGPIVKGIDNNFYKNRSYDKSANRSGALYMLTECDTELSRHLVIVGENMEDGSRFGDLDKMLDKEFFNNHRNITFDMLDGPHTWEVFSVHFVKETFDYDDLDFKDNTEYAAYIMMFKTLSDYKTDTNITYKDKVLTLATPYVGLEEGYLLLHARLVE